MANAKEIKERMASIEETRKITNAMYLITGIFTILLFPSSSHIYFPLLLQ